MQIKTYIVRIPNIITFLEYVLQFTSSVAKVSIIHKLTKIIHECQYPSNCTPTPPYLTTVN